MMRDTPVLIRPASTAEAAEIAAVQTTVWRSTYGGTVPAGFLDAEAQDRRTEHWQTMLGFSAFDHTIVVAERDSMIVGFVHAGIELEQRKIFALYVVPHLHGTGIGQLLLDSVLVDEATELWVARDNYRAVAFYRRNGFVPDGTAEDFPGISGFVTIRMVR